MFLTVHAPPSILISTLSLHDALPILVGLNGVLRVRDELRKHVDIRVVAFPQDGVIKDPGAEDLIRQGVQAGARSEEHTSELQSRGQLVCRLLLEKRNTNEEMDSA